MFNIIQQIMQKLLFCVLLCISITVHSQQYITAGYGYFPVIGLVDANPTKDIPAIPVFSRSDGTFSIGYINNRFTADVAYTGRKTTQNNKTGYKNFFNILVGYRYVWLHKNTFSLYSSASTGLNFHITSAKIEPDREYRYSIESSFHVCPIGIEIGKTLALNIETGFGVLGMMRINITYKLTNKNNLINTNTHESIQ